MIALVHSWRCDREPSDLCGWRIYASRREQSKGHLVGTAPVGERSAPLGLPEGRWFLRTVMEFAGCREQDWRACEVVEFQVHNRYATPSTPSKVGCGHVEPSLVGRVSCMAAAGTEPPAYLQVIEGPDEYRGKLVAEVPILERGPLSPDGSYQVSGEFPLEGQNTTRTLLVRAMSVGGKASSSVTRNAVAPTLEDFHAIAVASVSGTTLVNFPAAGATDGHEYDATDGLRLRTIGAASGLTGGAGGWGTGSAGLFATHGPIGKYVREWEVESDEVDLGATVTFRLEILDTIQRKSSSGALTLKKSHHLRLPAVPANSDEARGAAEGLPWLMRTSRADGKPRQPLRDCRWEYVAGTSSSVAHADSDYVPYIPGLWINARYVRLRLVLVEPTGYHQIIVPSITVQALVARRNVVGSGTPEASVTAPPGSRFVRTDSPPYHYVKVSGLGNTGWQAQASAIHNAPTITPAQITAAQNDYNPTGFSTARQVRISADSLANAVITGLVSDGTNRIVRVVNVGSHAFTFPAEDAGSSAANRFSAAATLPAGQSMEWGYDAGISRWRPHAVPSVASGAAGNLIDVTAGVIDVDLTESAALAAALDPIADEAIGLDASAAAPKDRRVLLADFAQMVVDRVTAAGTDFNTTTGDCSLYSKSIPAGWLDVDRGVRLTLIGRYRNFSGVASSLRLRVKFGSTTAVDDTSATIASDTDERSFKFVVELWAQGATNAQIVSLDPKLSAAVTPTQGTGTITLPVPIGGPMHKVIAEDTTGDLTLEVISNHSQNHATTTIQVLAARMEFLPGVPG